MFVNAIETVSRFTRPIHSIVRYYGSPDPVAGAGTLFFVNEEGWALTCAHVAKLIPDAEAINTQYQQYRNEFAARVGKEKEKRIRKELEAKFGYKKGSVVELRNVFVNCADCSGWEKRNVGLLLGGATPCGAPEGAFSSGELDQRAVLG